MHLRVKILGCRDALMRCLKLAAAPFLAQIWLWVFHGRLQPLPADSLEFFIVSNKEGAGGALALLNPCHCSGGTAPARDLVCPRPWHERHWTSSVPI